MKASEILSPLWIEANGKVHPCDPNDLHHFSLKEVQSLVGGYVEMIKLDEKRIMLVNEEGRLRNLPLNQKASEIAGQPIVGDVLVCFASKFK